MAFAAVATSARDPEDPRDAAAPGRRLLVINALEDGASVDIFYAGARGRGVWTADGDAPALRAGAMVCVAADVRSGFEFDVDVGAVGDEFVFARRAGGSGAERGAVAAAPARAARWAHARDDAATVFLLPERPAGAAADAELTVAVGSWDADADDFAAHAWRDGVGSLFEDADAALADGDEAGAAASFARARIALSCAALLGDTAAGTLLSLGTLAGVVPASPAYGRCANASLERAAPLDAADPVAAAHAAAVRRHALRGCWLGRLALGAWRSEGSHGFDQSCDVAVRTWMRLLEGVAAPGAGSPRAARVKVRHAASTPNELLVDHWLKADGFWTLREDARAGLADDDADAFDDDGAAGGAAAGGAAAGGAAAGGAAAGAAAGAADAGAAGAADAAGAAADAAAGPGWDPVAWLRRLALGPPDDFAPEVVFDGAPAEDAPAVLDLAAATYLRRRALGGDGHSALTLGDALLDGRVDDDALRELRRGGASPQRAAAEYYALAADDRNDEESAAHAAAALAELKLGGFDGVAADARGALELLERRAALTPFGAHVLGHLYAALDDEARHLPDAKRARGAFERAVDAGHPDAFVSLALETRDARKAERLLTAATRDHNSLTAPFVLARLHYDGALDDPGLEPDADGRYPYPSRHRRNRCPRALGALEAAVQQSWDASTVGFGVGDAVAAARAAWETPRPHAPLAAAWDVGGAAAPPADRGDAAAAFLDALKRRCAARLKRRRRDHALGLGARARAAGAYRMLATLAEAGVRAADVNAGFVLERLARRSPGGASGLLAGARRHYERALRPTTPHFERDKGLERPSRALEDAEAQRALGACWADGWAGACGGGGAPNGTALLRAAAARGSEWAAFDAAIATARAGDWRGATEIARSCAGRFDWPHAVPCAGLSALLGARAALFDGAWWRALDDDDDGGAAAADDDDDDADDDDDDEASAGWDDGDDDDGADDDDDDDAGGYDDAYDEAAEEEDAGDYDDEEPYDDDEEPYDDEDDAGVVYEDGRGPGDGEPPGNG